MKKSDQDELVERIKAAIDRFIGEIGPYWSKSSFVKLIGSLGYGPNLLDPTLKGALDTLVRDGTIHYIGKDDCFFIVSEKEAEKYFSGEFKDFILNQVRDLKKKYGV